MRRRFILLARFAPDDHRGAAGGGIGIGEINFVIADEMMQFQMIERLATRFDIIHSRNRLRRRPAQVRIIREDGFGEAGLQSSPILQVETISEARDYFLNLQLMIG